MNEQPSGGLMQALASFASRRPVHLIISKGDADGTLHVVCQPLRVGNDEDPEIGRGFSVAGSPAELDADLPAHVAKSWVPAHQGLQTVIDQVAAHVEQARQTALRKQKECGGKGKKDGGAGVSAQTTLTPPPAEAAAPAVSAADETATSPAPDDAAAPPAPVPPLPETPAEPTATPAPAGPDDGISSLFE